MVNQTGESGERRYFAHPSAVIDEDCVVGTGVKIWHFCHIMPHCRIGDFCILGQNVVVAEGVELGTNVRVQNNVSLYSGVICENNVFIGPSVVFTNVVNPRSSINRKAEFKKTIVGEGATLGANSTIVCGHTIGRYAFIGAGAVVTKDVLPYALVIGNPARQVGWMSESGHRLHFNFSNEARCPESGHVYYLKNEKTLVKLNNPD